VDIVVVLNRDSGTMKTLDPEHAAALVAETLAAAGHRVTVRLVEGPTCRPEIERILERRPEALIVGGGDGTVSTVAAMLEGRDTALGVIPLGTMNLFARTLGMPADFAAAVEALAGAGIGSADLAFVNGRPFVHQISLGLQVEMVRRRDESSYSSGLTKKIASLKAFLGTARNPPRLDIVLTVDGRRTALGVTGIVVSNNLYGPNHLPFADDPADGRLGVYYSDAERLTDLVQLATDLVLGSWLDNPAVTSDAGERVTIEGVEHGAVATLSIDGEIEEMPFPLVVTKRRQAIRVMLAGDEAQRRVERNASAEAAG